MNRTKYRPDIDGLRAIAVVLVLGFHAFPQVVPGGFVGVDVFFVISGFLITSIISTANFSFPGFYARRVRRLFPALALVLASSIVLGWVYLTPGQFEGLGNQALATALFVPNLFFWSEAGYFDSSALTKPLLHLWSLGVEEQFYFVWPALLLITTRFRLRAGWVLLSVTALSLLYCGYLGRTDVTQPAAFYSPLSRAWELSAGGLLALVGFRQYRPTLSTIGVIIGVGIIVIVSFYIKGSAGWPNAMTLPRNCPGEC